MAVILFNYEMRGRIKDVESLNWWSTDLEFLSIRKRTDDSWDRISKGRFVATAIQVERMQAKEFIKDLTILNRIVEFIRDQ